MIHKWYLKNKNYEENKSWFQLDKNPPPPRGVLLGIASRCWFAAHMCILSHFHMCDVCMEVRAERFLELCMRCACLWLVLGCAMCDILHTFWTKGQDLERLFLFLKVLFLFYNVLSCFKTSFPVFEHPFLFLTILYYFGTAYSNLEHPEICWKNVNCKQREENPLREHMRADVLRVFLTYVPTYYLPSSDTFSHTHTIYRLKFS